MSANGDQAETPHGANGAEQKTERWKRTRAVGAWFAASIGKPDNLPIYLGAIFTGLLAVFAYYAWNESTKSTAALRTQLCILRQQIAAEDSHFTRDERPILAADNLALPRGVQFGPHYYGATSTVIWNYAIRNYGKGSAFNIQFFEYMSVLGSPFESVKSGMPRPDNDVVPTQTFWSTATWGQKISAKDALKAYNTPSGIITKVIIRYTDASGFPFETIVCERHEGRFVFRNCIPADPDIRNRETVNPPPSFAPQGPSGSKSCDD